MNTKQTTKQDNPSAREISNLMPPVDVVEDASGITLYADLPGVPKDKLTVRIEANTLTISGEAAIVLPQGADPSYEEIPTPRYQRAFTLGQELNSENVTAELKHGVLKLHIPKTEHAKPRKIEVAVA